MKKQRKENNPAAHRSLQEGGTGGAIFQDNRNPATLQRKIQSGMEHSPKSEATSHLRKAMQETAGKAQAPLQRKGNTTGLPAPLKSGIENLSGYSMDDVKVHFNSSKPAQLQAHAYAQGSDIHLAPGQEKHLPHEAWHVVQQKQGRVKPTRQLKSKVNINDDAGLEKEADVMGAKALRDTTPRSQTLSTASNALRTVQRERDDEEEAEQEADNPAPTATLKQVQMLIRVVRRFLRRRDVARKEEKIRQLHEHFGMRWDGTFFFLTEGIKTAQIMEMQKPSEGNEPRTLWERMIAKYGAANPASAKTWLTSVLKSGSNMPDEIQVQPDDYFYKIMPFTDTGGIRNTQSVYYLNQEQFRALLDPTVNMEDILGLPTTTNFIRYKVYRITARVQTTVFESTIAPTAQYHKDEMAKGTNWGKGHRTSGGGTQTLILDNSNQAIWEKGAVPEYVLESGESSSERNIRGLKLWSTYQRHNE